MRPQSGIPNGTPLEGSFVPSTAPVVDCFVMVPAITTVDNDHDSLHLACMRFRPSRPGPEAQLVQQFFSESRLRAFPDCRITAFKEPKLEGAYPDIVLVVWRPSVTRTWRPERKNINASDLRLLQHLVACGDQPDADLVRLFGIGYKSRVERLKVADLILRTGKSWRAKPLSSIFAAVAIVAIEAKISNWGTALQQAFLNTWFASNSYVLVPGSKVGDKLAAAASAKGVGILSTDACLSFKRSRMLPRSYASWQLNEWAWRASLAA